MTDIVQGPDLKVWFRGIVTEELGLQTVSRSPKPVHVLHGFFNRLTDGRRMTRLTADLVARRQGTWKVSQDEIRQRHDKILLPDSAEGLNDLRLALTALLTSDDAFFHNNNSSQLAHVGMTSSDPTHGDLGTLAASLVSTHTSSRIMVENAFERLQQPQPNPHWGVQQTLIMPEILQEWILRDVIAPAWAEHPSTKDLWAHSADLLHKALEILTGSDSLLGLQVVATTATWVGLLAYAQVPSLQTRNELTPLLMECTAPGAIGSLRNASHDQLIDCHTTFEVWLADRMQAKIEEDFGPSGPTNAKQVAHYLSSHQPFELAGGEKKAKLQSERMYGSYTAAGQPPLQALASTLRDLCIMEMGNMHRDWFHSVGRHVGFVGPRRGQLARVRSEVNLLPALVLAGMPSEAVEGIPMVQWADEIAARFGLLIGPTAQARALHSAPSEEALLANSAELSRLLVEVGLARRYSDGVTEILDPRTLWSAQA